MPIVLLYELADARTVFTCSATLTPKARTIARSGSSISGSATLTNAKSINIRKAQLTVVASGVMTAAQPKRIMKNAITGMSARGTIVARQPVLLRYSEVNPMSGSASIVAVEPVRIRHVDDPALYGGTGEVALQSDMWKYMTVRGALVGKATLEAYFYEFRDIRQSMSDYIPKYYADSLEAKEILQTEASEFVRFNSYAIDVLHQFFPATATWSLNRWEKLFHIDNDVVGTIDERREEIIERISGFYMITLAELQKQAEKFWAVSITQDPKNFTVTITILDKTVDATHPKYAKFVRKMVALIPVHLELIILFKQTTWAELKTLGTTWDEIKLYSWEDVTKASFE